MSVINAVVELEKARRQGASAGIGKINAVLQRQNIKRLSQKYLKAGDLSQAGRVRFMMQNGVDENTMAAIQKVTDIVLTGGQDLGGTKIGDSMVSSRTGDVMFQAAKDPISLGSGNILVDPNTYETIAANPKTQTPTPISLDAGDILVDPNTFKTVAQNPKTQTRTKLANLLAERDKYPEGHPFRTAYDEAISKETTRTGMRIESDGQGGFTVLTNADQATGGMTPTVKSGVQKEILDYNAQLQRITEVASEFKPEYQELGTRWGNLATKWKEKAGMDVSKADKEKLTKFSEYRRNAVDNINRYIQLITGAQMSAEEAARLMKGMPNPGTGLFDGDSPTEFQAKLSGVIKDLKMALARLNYVNTNGLTSYEDIAIENMPAIIDRRGAQLESKFKESGMGAAEIETAVTEQLKQEFGLMF